MAEWTAITGADVKDIRFSLTPEAVDSTTRQTLLDNFDSYGFANSETAMKNIASSSTVMDEVAGSQTAIDAVSASQTAIDAVSASQMAVGKFVAGSAGLTPSNYADINAVVSDASAMDAVAGSQTAMDAVSASTLAYSGAFGSDYSVSSLWASTPGAKTILANSGDKTLPYNTSTPGGDANIEVDDGTQSATPGDTAHHLWIDMNGADEGNYVSISYTIDLSNADTLELKDKAEGQDYSQLKHGVKVDGSSIFDVRGTNGYNTRSLDISSYNDEHDVEFYADNGDFNDNNIDQDYYFADLDLI